jgi:hypothetical protein
MLFKTPRKSERDQRKKATIGEILEKRELPYKRSAMGKTSAPAVFIPKRRHSCPGHAKSPAPEHDPKTRFAAPAYEPVFGKLRSQTTNWRMIPIQEIGLMRQGQAFC